MVSKILFVGNVAPQAPAVWEVLRGSATYLIGARSPEAVRKLAPGSDLIVVAGYRHLIPPEVLAIPRLGTVGFHSAKLPEYPGRAPIPWTLLRGDTHAWNTMLYLDEGVDSGDVIDAEAHVIQPDDTPESLYRWVAESDARLLRRHLAGILAGNAPRTPQAASLRGPLTTKDGWDRLAGRELVTPDRPRH